MPRRPNPPQPRYTCPQCAERVPKEDSSIPHFMKWWVDNARPHKPPTEEELIGWLTKTRNWACRSCLKAGRAILPNYNHQNYGLGGPIPIYADQKRGCRDCRQPFVFTAAEQQFWFEGLGFNYESKAIRCAPCRKKLRAKKAAAQRLGTLLATEPVTVAVLEEIAAEYDAINNPTKATLYRARARNLANRLDGRGE